jgi:putative transposase
VMWPNDPKLSHAVRRDLAASLTKWSGKYSKLASWVENNIEETVTCLPLARRKHMQSTNTLSRLNGDIR